MNHALPGLTGNEENEMPTVFGPQGENNKTAASGCHRCYCGGKYWEQDTCIACGLRHNPDNYGPGPDGEVDFLIGQDDPEVNPYLLPGAVCEPVQAGVNYWQLWYEQARVEQEEILDALRGLVGLTGEEDEKTQGEAWEKAREAVALHSVALLESNGENR